MWKEKVVVMFIFVNLMLWLFWVLFREVEVVVFDVLEKLIV